jgi:hypothetical protein
MSLAPWFKSLEDPLTKSSCCGMADCRNYPVRIFGGHYEVQYEGVWIIVNNNRILSRLDNPTGDYVACIDNGYIYGAIPYPEVICFVRRPGT